MPSHFLLEHMTQFHPCVTKHSFILKSIAVNIRSATETIEDPYLYKTSVEKLLSNPIYQSLGVTNQHQFDFKVCKLLPLDTPTCLSLLDNT